MSFILHNFRITLVLLWAITVLPLPAGAVFVHDRMTSWEAVQVQIVKVYALEDLRAVLQDARSKGLKVSIAGQWHAQGGQQSYPAGIVLDMRPFNKILALDTKNKTIEVQAGATWKQIEDYIEPFGLAPMIIQDRDMFTIGGSLSANIHGNDPNFGSMIESVRSLHLMLADGKIIEASRYKNQELFRLAIGGYGLFGIIIDAEIMLTDNVLYAESEQDMTYSQYPAFFRAHILNHGEIGQEYNFFIPASHQMLLRAHIYTKVMAPKGRMTISRINHVREVSLKYANPPRMIMQEYFIPIDHFVYFIDRLMALRHGAPSLRTIIHEVRYVRASREDFLSYAKFDDFAVSVDFSIKSISAPKPQDIRVLTEKIVDLALDCGGTFYLSKIAVYPDKAQLLRAYPEFAEFARKKKEYDPHEIFMNQFYAHYAK